MNGTKTTITPAANSTGHTVIEQTYTSGMQTKTLTLQVRRVMQSDRDEAQVEVRLAKTFHSTNRTLAEHFSLILQPEELAAFVTALTTVTIK